MGRPGGRNSNTHISSVRSQNPRDLQPNIFNYQDFRRYLADQYRYLKSHPRQKFNFAIFSEKAGFTAANMMKLVVDGKRNLSLDRTQKLAVFFALNREQTRYFLNLVQLNQSKSHAERQHYARELVDSRVFEKFHPISQAQFEFYSHWYYVAIYTLVGFRDFLEDAELIGSCLSPAISAREVKKALHKLEVLGLIRRNEIGRLEQTNATIETEDELSSQFVAEFHRAMLVKGLEALETVDRQDRNISSVTVSFSKQTFKEASELIHRFRREMLALGQRDPNPSNVYQINFELFPLLKKGGLFGVE